MYSHVMVGSNDIDASKTFYDAVFTSIGGSEGRLDPKDMPNTGDEATATRAVEI